MKRRSPALIATAVLFTLVALAGCGTNAKPSLTPSPSPTISPSTTTTTTTGPSTGPPVEPSATAAPTTTAIPTTTGSTAAPKPTPSVTRPTQQPTPPSAQPTSVMVRVPTSRHVVALTFDAGSGAQGVGSILATLARERVPATFFLTGRFAAAQPAVVRQIAAGGYLIGNHTVDHPHLPALSDAAVRAEVTDAATTIKSISGRDTHPWFRFPYGESDLRTRQIVAGLGFRTIGWTVDTLGWKGRAAGGPDDVVRRVLGALGPGTIVLMHVGANPDDQTTFDADSLPRLIDAVRAAGYGFTTVAGDVAAP